MILCPLPGRLWRITQRYPDRPGYYAKYNLKSHAGLDIAPLIPGTKGVVVYAPHEGFVELNDFGKNGYGKHVYVTSEPYDRKGTRRQSVLGHLESFLVSSGQYVAAGDPIGVMGSTGDSTNIHVHWGYRKLNKDEEVINKNNGNNGYIDVSPYACVWSLTTLA